MTEVELQIITIALERIAAGLESLVRAMALTEEDRDVGTDSRHTPEDLKREGE